MTTLFDKSTHFCYILLDNLSDSNTDTVSHLNGAWWFSGLVSLSLGFSGPVHCSKRETREPETSLVMCKITGTVFRVFFLSFLYTSRTALMQPSFSGLFVTWAYLPTGREKEKRFSHCSYVDCKYGSLLYKVQMCSTKACHPTLTSLTPDDLSPLCDQTQLADVDLHNGSLGDDPQRGVEGGRGVFLHPQDGQAERGLQLWVGHMGLFET